MGVIWSDLERRGARCGLRVYGARKESRREVRSGRWRRGEGRVRGSEWALCGSVYREGEGELAGWSWLSFEGEGQGLLLLILSSPNGDKIGIEG